ncbi:hypothetical protein E8L99_07270 [Phreatobacter aquaticus]|uniref:Uncharacterized protein n=1 Tax=Phreatobacter aquaticus TaxID=2570229 RepID=A0A4D7QN44_9HYPH|nr:hypothetical protein [Phreatobacter aquaticus]QCK85582.1 hypothetical protein E8L99_07270 [Phreatobacter aquaticus]
MTFHEFETAMVRFGDDLAAWPQAEQAAARALLAASAEARRLLDETLALRLMFVDRAPSVAPSGLADRIIRRAMELSPADRTRR